MESNLPNNLNMELLTIEKDLLSPSENNLIKKTTHKLEAGIQKIAYGFLTQTWKSQEERAIIKLINLLDFMETSEVQQHNPNTQQQIATMERICLLLEQRPHRVRVQAVKNIENRIAILKKQMETEASTQELPPINIAIASKEEEKALKAIMRTLSSEQELVSMRSKPTVTILRCLLERTHSSNSDLEKFNRSADKLKSETNWHSILEEYVDNLSDRELVHLSELSLNDLRGFDREILAHLYAQAFIQISKKELLDHDALKQMSDVLNSLIPKIIVVDESQKKFLGGGAVNKVFKITYTNDRGESVQGVFKPEPATLPLPIQSKEAICGSATALGIPIGSKGFLLDRSVASSVLDQFIFGPDKGISVKTEHVIVNGQRGILMGWAEGSSPATTAMAKVKIDLEEHPELKEFVVSHLNGKAELDARDLNFVAVMSNFRNIKAVAIENQEGKKEWAFTGVNPSFETFDPKDPDIAEGLLKLQLFDFISGQGDRHTKNYIIGKITDAKGQERSKVQAIDNDVSWGVKALPLDVDVRRQKAILGIIPNNGSLMLRPPMVITRELKDTLMASFSEEKIDELVVLMAPYIDDAEMAAMLRRIEILLKHLDEKALVVDSKEELLSPKAKKLINRDNSYWARELLIYNSNKTNWNHLRR